MNKPPSYWINSSAPTRICDNGGWTDTWFAEHGEVFQIAIEPRARVQIGVYPPDALEGRLVITAANYHDTYVRHPGTPWQKHPLIEAAIDLIGVPDEHWLHIYLQSEAPPGASIGTSASMTVALLGALDTLAGKHTGPQELARQAHRVETELLEGQSGIQDQLAAAYGGINLIEIERYPHARVTTIRPAREILWRLQEQLLLVVLGKPHHSSKVHEKVVSHLEDAGPNDPRLEALRETAKPARDALLAGNFTALGRTFIENTEAQRALHPDLINPLAQQVIDLADEHQALGWKVNGAGGEGGSVALLLDGSARNQANLTDALAGCKGCLILTPLLAVDGLRRFRVDAPPPTG